MCGSPPHPPVPTAMSTVSFLHAATVPVFLAQTIIIELAMGEVSFFEYQVPEEGLTLTLRRLEGTANLYASNKVRNPNSAFHDYRIDGEGRAFVDLGELLGGEGDGRRRRRQSGVVLLGNTTLYVSAEGIGDLINSFEIEATLGNTGTSLRHCSYSANSILQG